MSIDTAKTIFQGMLGGMTFGAYHQFNTNKLMEINNESMRSINEREMNELKLNHKQEMKDLEYKLEKQHRMEMDALERKFEEKLIQSRRWF
jgi:hypothetical protein